MSDPSPNDDSETSVSSDHRAGDEFTDDDIGADDRIQSDERSTNAAQVDAGGDPRNESTQIANEERRRNTAFVSGIVAVIGAWVALSVLVYDVATASLWNNVAVGAVVFLAAGYNYYRLSNDIPLSTGIATLVALLGLWLIVAAALLEMTMGLFWSTAVSGLLIAGLAGYNAYESREATTVATDPDSGTR